MHSESANTRSLPNCDTEVKRDLVPGIKNCSLSPAPPTKEKEVETGVWKEQGQKKAGWSNNVVGKGGWATTWESRKDVPRGRTWAEKFQDYRFYSDEASAAAKAAKDHECRSE